jgi:hypothetical protein
MRPAGLTLPSASDPDLRTNLRCLRGGRVRDFDVQDGLLVQLGEASDCHPRCRGGRIRIGLGGTLSVRQTKRPSRLMRRRSDKQHKARRYPAQIPQEVAGSHRPRPVIPARQPKKSPALARKSPHRPVRPWNA